MTGAINNDIYIWDRILDHIQAALIKSKTCSTVAETKCSLERESAGTAADCNSVKV
jgi:hypothetical protein